MDGVGQMRREGCELVEVHEASSGVSKLAAH